MAVNTICCWKSVLHYYIIYNNYTKQERATSVPLYLVSFAHVSPICFSA